jgi:hypothetical protein
MTIPVYTMPRTPGAPETTEWTAISHRKEPFVVIEHERLWVRGYHVHERARPFLVQRYARSQFSKAFIPMEIGWYSTLEKAQAAAKRTAEEPV